MFSVWMNKRQKWDFSEPLTFTPSSGGILALWKVWKNSAENLGLIFDNTFTFDEWIDAAVRASFYLLRAVAKGQAFSFLHWLWQSASGLHFIQAWWLEQSLFGYQPLPAFSSVTCPKRCSSTPDRQQHISPVLASLHWLPVDLRVDFKIFLLVFKALNELEPSYLLDVLTFHTSRRWLRSAEQMLLAVQRSRLKLRGDGAFTVAAAKLWNNLPLHIRSSATLRQTDFYSPAFKPHWEFHMWFYLLSFSLNSSWSSYFLDFSCFSF